MTNAEIIELQRAARQHREALPGAICAARAALHDKKGGALPDTFTAYVRVPELRTLLREIERLQKRERDLNEDIREEQRGQRDAYAEGRYDERVENGSGW